MKPFTERFKASNAKRTSLVLESGRKAHASITQKPEATRAALSDVIGIEDIASLIFAYLTPMCATIDDLAKIGAKSRHILCAALAVSADATLQNSNSFYILGFRHAVVGDSKWRRFLMETRHKGLNALATVLWNGTEVPLHLLRHIIPQNEDDKVEYALQRNSKGSSLMILWALFPALCARMIQPSDQRRMPLFHVLGPYSHEKVPVNAEVLQQLVVQLLPRDEDPVTHVADVRRFKTRVNGKNILLMNWLSERYPDFDASVADEITRKLHRVFGLGPVGGFHRGSGVHVFM